MGESEAKLETKDWDPTNLGSSDECEQSKHKRFIQDLEPHSVLFVCVGTNAPAELMSSRKEAERPGAIRRSEKGKRPTKATGWAFPSTLDRPH